MTEKNLREYYGDNYLRFLVVSQEVRNSMKKDFRKKYPGADMSRFEFSPSISRKVELIDKIIYFKVDDDSSYDIESDAFRNNRKWTWYLYQWRRIWSVHGTIQPFIKNSTDLRVNSLKIYVTSDQFFEITLPELDISNSESNDYKDNTYLAALFAAYITTYSCGICAEHLEYTGETPNIITSIARYHLYYHMKRFVRQPGTMTRFITKEMKTTVTNNKPVAYEWTDEFHQGGENVNYWVSKQPRGTIRNARSVMSKNGVSGQVGISYQKRGKHTIRGLDDYKVFIATKSNGLTETGQLLLQQSVESYVYCVLGSQARTRWPIVGRGAMSIQTQEVFRKLATDTIIQNDQTVAISNMRKAIKDTNVVLNMAISPGIILIPSDMIILTEMIAGYNNILTLAGQGMRFGENDGINRVATTPSVQRSKVSPEVSKMSPSVQQPKISGSAEVSTGGNKGVHRPAASAVVSIPSRPQLELYLLAVTVVCGSLISRFVI